MRLFKGRAERLAFLLTVIAIAAAAAASGSTRFTTWDGFVHSTDGMPIADATVVFVSTSDKGAQTTSAPASTDGRFSINLGESSGPITVFAPGFSPWFGHFDGAQVPPDIIRLGPAGTVDGIVRTSDGSPLAGIFVDVLYDVSRLPTPPAIDTDGGARVSGARGTFQVTNVAAHLPFRIQLSRGPAVLGYFGPYTVSGGGSLSMAFEVPSLPHISGVVEDVSGMPVQAARVRLTRLNQDPKYISVKPLTLFVNTDTRGRFDFPPAMSGEFQLAVTKAGFGSHQQRVKTQPADALNAIRIRISR